MRTDQPNNPPKKLPITRDQFKALFLYGMSTLSILILAIGCWTNNVVTGTIGGIMTIIFLIISAIWSYLYLDDNGIPFLRFKDD